MKKVCMLLDVPCFVMRVVELSARVVRVLLVLVFDMLLFCCCGTLQVVEVLVGFVLCASFEIAGVLLFLCWYCLETGEVLLVFWWGLLQVCGGLQILEGFCICKYENLKFGI
jgi:hypothetical protein